MARFVGGMFSRPAPEKGEGHTLYIAVKSPWERQIFTNDKTCITHCAPAALGRGVLIPSAVSGNSTDVTAASYSPVDWSIRFVTQHFQYVAAGIAEYLACAGRQGFLPFAGDPFTVKGVAVLRSRLSTTRQLKKGVFSYDALHQVGRSLNIEKGEDGVQSSFGFVQKVFVSDLVVELRSVAEGLARASYVFGPNFCVVNENFFEFVAADFYGGRIRPLHVMDEGDDRVATVTNNVHYLGALEKVVTPCRDHLAVVIAGILVAYVTYAAEVLVIRFCPTKRRHELKGRRDISLVPGTVIGAIRVYDSVGVGQLLVVFADSLGEAANQRGELALTGAVNLGVCVEHPLYPCRAGFRGADHEQELHVRDLPDLVETCVELIEHYERASRRGAA